MSQESPIKESFRNIGRSLDSGVSSLMREFGANVRVICPSCNQVSQAPPNEDVECPHCKYQFHSASFSERTSQVSSDLRDKSKQSWEARKQKQHDTQQQVEEGLNVSHDPGTTQMSEGAHRGM